MSKLKSIILLLLIFVSTAFSTDLTCQELALYTSTRPGLCLAGNCPTAYYEPTIAYIGCPELTRCCIFERLECRTQGDGVTQARCFTGNVCPTGLRSVRFDIGCDEDQLCCTSGGISCADQAYSSRPWLCLDGFCPDQYGYRSVFWNSGCPSNNHRCCI